METILLQTKLYIPPTSPSLIPRPHLIKRINQGFHEKGKLTLVSAPAGFGKTTLISEWISQSNALTAWLSLDKADNDPARFLTYFIAALQQLDPNIGQTAQMMLQSPAAPVSLPVETVMTTLINDITAVSIPPNTRAALILDDYHTITTPAIHNALTFLLDHMPPQLHLVITSRSDPFLPLSRLRARGLMSEIRADDLRFTPDEAAAFLNTAMGLTLSGDDVAALESRTEGWIAGLQLAALSMQNRQRNGENLASFIAAFTGDDRYIVDYLVDEVFAGQPDDTQNFLLFTAVLDRMTGSLCDAITEQKNGQAMLERLEQANLFVVSLDNRRRWYRYHHLFADMLRHRLRVSQPDLIPVLYQRASAWYEAMGQMETAVSYALTANDNERAARLLNEIAPSLLLNSEIEKLLQWADALLQSARQQYPLLCIFHAFALQFANQLDAVEPMLALAESHLKAASEPPIAPLTAVFITSYAATIRAYVARRRGDFERAAELSQQALHPLSSEPVKQALRTAPTNRVNDINYLRGTIVVNQGVVYKELGQMEAAGNALLEAVNLNQATGNLFATAASIAHLMHLQIAQGKLRQAEQLGREGIEWMEAQGDGGKKSFTVPAIVEIQIEMGRILYEWNDLAGMMALVNWFTKWEKLTMYLGQNYGVMIYLNWALGHQDVAFDYLQKLNHLMNTASPSQTDLSVESQIVQVKLLLYRSRPDLDYLLSDASWWTERANFTPADDFGYADEHKYATLAHVLLAQGRSGETLPLLNHLCQAAELTARNGDLVIYLIWQALAYQAQDQIDQAVASLAQALPMAHAESYMRSFVDEGEPMASLLRQVALRNIMPDYVNELLTAFGEKQQRNVPSSTLLVEPLSKRELDVLHWLKTDLSSPEIALELIVSVNTIRFHTKNIYRKLDVTNRRTAVRRAEELGL